MSIDDLSLKEEFQLYLKRVPKDQPVPLDDVKERELDLLLYYVGFRAGNRDNRIVSRKRSDSYDLLVQTNIFYPDWRRERETPQNNSGENGLEDTVHDLTSGQHEFSYLSFPTKEELGRFLDCYCSMKHNECHKLGNAGTELVNVKKYDLKPLFKTLTATTAMSEVVPIIGAVKDGISLASAGLALGIAATAAGIYCLGNYVSNSRIKKAERKVEIVQTDIEDLKSEIEKYRPITLLNKDALEKALEN